MHTVRIPSTPARGAFYASTSGGFALKALSTAMDTIIMVEDAAVDSGSFRDVALFMLVVLLLD